MHGLFNTNSANGVQYVFPEHLVEVFFFFNCTNQHGRVLLQRNSTVSNHQQYSHMHACARAQKCVCGDG